MFKTHEWKCLSTSKIKSQNNIYTVVIRLQRGSDGGGGVKPALSLVPYGRRFSFVFISVRPPAADTKRETK